MKTGNKYPFIVSVLMAVLGFMLTGRVTAQTLTTLYSFTASSTNFVGDYTNSEGANPGVGVVLSGNTLYGAANRGGSSGWGTVFAVSANGTGLTVLHTFTSGIDRGPAMGLILSGNTLYGTALNGGSADNGRVFAVNTNGTAFTNLYTFLTTTSSGQPNYSNTNSDGARPFAGLLLSGNTLYGTSYGGGSSGNGTVFKLNTDGTGITNLHSFAPLPFDSLYTNSEGANPVAGLILAGNTLYGTANHGGISGNGTVFAVNTDGTGFTNLHSFTGESGNSGPTNSDGAYPEAGLIVSGSILYGTAPLGGSSGGGTVFAINTDGSGFTNLHSFTVISGPFTDPPHTNSDGANPYASLALMGNTLFGTAIRGGAGGAGTVFSLNTDGTGFTVVHSFTTLPYALTTTNTDGGYPMAELVLSGNTLYGTTLGGGSSGNGTVFSLSFPPQLSIIPSDRNVILTWPTNYAWFNLQSTMNLVSPVWTTNSPAPVVVNGQNTVTNPISGTKQFFRLSQ